MHGLGTCPHPSPVAARGSVKLQSIAIRFEPLRPEKGHAINSTAKRFRETTNPEIKHFIILLLFSFTVKDSRTICQKMPFTFELLKNTNKRLSCQKFKICITLLNNIENYVVCKRFFSVYCCCWLFHITHFKSFFLLNLVPVALWGHLWYRPCRKGSGDGVQPHISQRHWQEVGNAQVFHGTPDRAAHRSTGEDKLLELHQHQSRDSLTCLVPPGLSAHPDGSRSTPAVNKRPVISCDQSSSTTPIKAKCQSNFLVWLQAVKSGN